MFRFRFVLVLAFVFFFISDVFFNFFMEEVFVLFGFLFIFIYFFKVIYFSFVRIFSIRLSKIKYYFKYLFDVEKSLFDGLRCMYLNLILADYLFREILFIISCKLLFFQLKLVYNFKVLGIIVGLDYLRNLMLNFMIFEQSLIIDNICEWFIFLQTFYLYNKTFNFVQLSTMNISKFLSFINNSKNFRTIYCINKIKELLSKK